MPNLVEIKQQPAVLLRHLACHLIYDDTSPGNMINRHLAYRASLFFLLSILYSECIFLV